MVFGITITMDQSVGHHRAVAEVLVLSPREKAGTTREAESAPKFLFWNSRYDLGAAH